MRAPIRRVERVVGTSLVLDCGHFARIRDGKVPATRRCNRCWLLIKELPRGAQPEAAS